MRGNVRFTQLAVFVFGSAAILSQPQTGVAAQQSAVPRVIQFNGTVTGMAQNSPLSPSRDNAPQIRSVTFALYREQSGGAPLWQETQNVALDAEGHFMASIGSANADGLPLHLFAAGEPRWLGYRLNNADGAVSQDETRVFLASIPYALKSGDAETLAGHPPSDFLLNPRRSPDDAASADDAPLDSIAGSGTANTLAKWLDNAGTLGDSVVKESSGKIGIGTAAPAATLDVAGAALFNSFIGMRAPVLPTRPYSGDLLWSWTNGLVFDTGSAGRGIAFNTNDNTKMWIDDVTGRVTIGNGVSAGGARLSVRGNGAIGSGYMGSVAPADGLIVQGNVGIGTTSPATKLDISGDLRTTGTATAAALALPNTTLAGTGMISFGGNRFIHNFGVNNTSIGQNAGSLSTSTFATDNTAAGFLALGAITTGAQNTAAGSSALAANTTGNLNTATGSQALSSNTAGALNTAVGAGALKANASGNFNSAQGANALTANTTGFLNTAIGFGAMQDGTNAIRNTGLGVFALQSSTGVENVATGYQALANTTTGNNNTAIGNYAGFTLNSGNANVTGSNNTFIGYAAGPGTATQLTNATAIGANAVVTANNSLVLGDTNASVGIGTSAPVTRLQVGGDIRVGTSGTNGCIQDFSGAAIAGTCSSDERLKQNIESFPSMLETIVQLQPVTYDWQRDEHPEYHFGPERASGLIAQDVEKLFPSMVATDDRGFKAVKYSELPLLLLQAIREQQAQIQQLQAEVERLRNERGR